MNIACCIFKYFEFGGLQIDFSNIVRELVRRKHHVRIYTKEWQGLVINNTELSIIRCSGFTNCREDEEFTSKVLKDIKKRPVDIIIGFNKMPGLDVYYAGDVCYKERIKRKYLGFIQKLTPRYRHHIRYEQAIFESSSKTLIVALNQHSINSYIRNYGTDIRRFYLLAPNVVAVNNTTINKNFNPSVEKKKFGIPDDKVVLLQVATNFRLKGLYRTFNAIASLREDLRKKVKLVIVGDGNKEEALNLGRSLKIEQNLIFIGSSTEVNNIMRISDIFLHPAEYDSAGKVILEALFASLPSIVTDTCGYACYVKQASSGIVLKSPFNQKELNNTLTLYLTNDALISKLKNNAFLFSSNFKYKEYYADFSEFIEKIRK